MQYTLMVIIEDILALMQHSKMSHAVSKVRHFLPTVSQLTIHRCLARQHHYYQLQPRVCVLQIAKHWFNLVRIGSIFTETRLAHNWHTGICRDLLKLLRKVPKQVLKYKFHLMENTEERYLAHMLSKLAPDFNLVFYEACFILTL